MYNEIYISGCYFAYLLDSSSGSIILDMVDISMLPGKRALYSHYSNVERKDPREDTFVCIYSLHNLLDTTIFIFQILSRPNPFFLVGTQEIDFSLFPPCLVSIEDEQCKKFMNRLDIEIRS